MSHIKNPTRVLLLEVHKTISENRRHRITTLECTTITPHRTGLQVHLIYRRSSGAKDRGSASLEDDVLVVHSSSSNAPSCTLCHVKSAERFFISSKNKSCISLAPLSMAGGGRSYTRCGVCGPHVDASATLIELIVLGTV